MTNLTHYGVKGMKWGVRKRRKEDGRSSRSGKTLRRLERNIYDNNPSSLRGKKKRAILTRSDMKKVLSGIKLNQKLSDDIVKKTRVEGTLINMLNTHGKDPLYKVKTTHPVLIDEISKYIEQSWEEDA